MKIKKLVRLVVSVNKEVDSAMSALEKLGMKSLKNFKSLNLIDGYFQLKRRKEVEAIPGVQAVTAHVPKLKEPKD